MDKEEEKDVKYKKIGKEKEKEREKCFRFKICYIIFSVILVIVFLGGGVIFGILLSVQRIVTDKPENDSNQHVVSDCIMYMLGSPVIFGVISVVIFCIPGLIIFTIIDNFLGKPNTDDFCF